MLGCKNLVVKPDLPDCYGRCEKCKNNSCMKNIDLMPVFDWLNLV